MYSQLYLIESSFYLSFWCVLIRLITSDGFGRMICITSWTKTHFLGILSTLLLLLRCEDVCYVLRPHSLSLKKSTFTRRLYSKYPLPLLRGVITRHPNGVEVGGRGPWKVRVWIFTPSAVFVVVGSLLSTDARVWLSGAHTAPVSYFNQNFSNPMTERFHIILCTVW